jgi:hypothetical protein
MNTRHELTDQQRAVIALLCVVIGIQPLPASDVIGNDDIDPQI